MTASGGQQIVMDISIDILFVFSIWVIVTTLVNMLAKRINPFFSGLDKNSVCRDLCLNKLHMSI